MSTLLVNTVKDVAAAHTLDMTSFPGVQSFRITSSADTALGTCASGGTRVGSSFSATIPTSGKLRVVVNQAQFNWTNSANASVGVALEVNGTTYFVQNSQNSGGTVAYPIVFASTVPNGIIRAPCAIGPALTAGWGPVVEFDIAALGCATGTQTCYIKLGHTAAVTSGWSDAVTVKGTATTFVASVEIIGLSA